MAKKTTTEKEESNLVLHAKHELALIGLKPDSKEPMDKLMYEYLIDLVQKFADQGHSGFSANYAVGLLIKLLRYEPVTPLTGEDDEWTDVSGMTGQELHQNKRCSHVFKAADGRPYDIEGKVFVRPDGDAYTNAESHVFIEFPYTPKVEYVNVDESGNVRE